MALVSSVALAGCSGVNLAIPPIEVGGGLENQSVYRQTGASDQQFTNRVRGTVSSASYIWQPWFARVSGNLNVAQQTQVGGTSDTNSTLASGGFSLAALPVSRYPATLSYNHTDSRVDGVRAGGDLIRDRVSLLARAALLSGWSGGSTISYDNVRQPGFGGQESFGANLSVNKSFDKQDMSLAISHSQSDFTSETVDELDETEVDSNVRFRHTYRPFKDVDVQSSSILRRSDETIDGISREELSLQGISTAQWRPKQYPFTVNGALRTLTEEINFSGGDLSRQRDTSIQLATGTLGLNYPISHKLNANAGLRGNYQSTERGLGGQVGESAASEDTTLGFTALGGVSYLEDPRPVAGFSWRWNANARAEASAELEGDFTNTASVGIGQSGSRSIDVPWLGPVQMVASESLTLRYDEFDGFAPQIVHTANFTRSIADEGSRTFITLSATDNREIAGRTPDEFQLLGFSLNRTNLLNRDQQWYANVGIQVTRRKFKDEEAAVTFGANGRVGYSHRNLFSVQNLNLLSELILDSIGFDNVVDDREDRFFREPRARWETRLDYRLGLLEFTLETQVFANGSRPGGFVLFRVRRAFQGIF